jgi:hypothetical protein
MDMNELFRRHQLALMAMQQELVSGTPSSAAQYADDCAKAIKSAKPEGTPYRRVLSSHTFLALAAS